MEVQEPMAAYGTADIQELRQQVIRLVEESQDEDELRMCISLMRHEPMPCCFSEEELDEEIRLSEASGYVDDQDFVKSCYETWGVAL